MKRNVSSQQKTIFLTGATGFVGSYLAAELLAAGHRLILLVRPHLGDPSTRVHQAIESASHLSNVPPSAWDKLDIIVGDITKRHLGLDRSTAERIARQVDAVFHCAASVSFDEKKDAIEQCNVLGTQHVIDLLTLSNHPEFHYISTAYVSGCRDNRVLEEAFTDTIGFNNWYEETKLRAEQLVLKYRRTHPKTTIYRPSIIVGRFADGYTTGFRGFYRFLAMVDAFFSQVQKRAIHAAFVRRFAGIEQRDGFWHIPMRVPGRLGKTLNLVPIDFVIKGVMTIFRDESAHGNIYHLVNPSPLTIGGIKQVIDTMYHVTGIQLIDPEDFSRTRPTPLESLFLATTHRYMFYLQNPEPRFDDANARRILQRAGIVCPRIDRPAIERIIAFARESSWGKPVK